MIKAVSDNKKYIVLYTDWHRVGFKYQHSITWKCSNQTEGQHTFTIGFFTFWLLGRKKLDIMINNNVQKIVEEIKCLKL